MKNPNISLQQPNQLHQQWQGMKKCTACGKIADTWTYFRSLHARFQRRPTKQCLDCRTRSVSIFTKNSINLYNISFILL